MTKEQWWPSRADWPVYPSEMIANGTILYRGGASEALALLILEDIVIPLWGKDSIDQSTVALYVLCSDTFACACADAEPLPPIGFGQDGPFWDLYDGVREHGDWAAIAWCVQRRKRSPLPGIVKVLKEMGIWDKYELQVYVKESTP